MSVWLLVIYGVGCPIWLYYALNRFCKAHNGEEVLHIYLAFCWPACVAVYVPYRIFRRAVRSMSTRHIDTSFVLLTSALVAWVVLTLTVVL